MISDIIIAYNDDLNEESKHFFESCADSVRQKAVESSLKYHNLDSTKLFHSEVERAISEINSNFIFSAFSHGAKSALFNHQSEEYVSVTTNNFIFGGSIVYTFACECGCDLRNHFVDLGVASFWGYKENVSICPHVEEFVTCATEGLAALLEGKTIQESLNQMKAMYDNSILSLKNSSHVLEAAFLLDNKEALTVYGADELNISIL
jgi:hypothetical protein